MNKKYQFEDYLPHTGIKRWDDNRKNLNKIIKSFNKWQIKHDFDPERINKLLAKIEYGRQIVDTDGEYTEILDNMENFVKTYKDE